MPSLQVFTDKVYMLMNETVAYYECFTYVDVLFITEYLMFAMFLCWDGRNSPGENVGMCKIALTLTKQAGGEWAVEPRCIRPSKG